MIADKLNYTITQNLSSDSACSAAESFLLSAAGLSPGGSPPAVGPDGNPPLLVPNGCQSPTLQSAKNAAMNRRRARFMVKALRGVECGLSKGYRFRWFVLTESDEALSAGLDFGHEFNKFVTWLRKVHCGDFQYIAVEHRQGLKERRNWHVLSYGSDRLPVYEMREYWKSHYKSTVTGMAEVVDIRKSVKYLAGYLSGDDKFVRSWCSQGWVFPGWLGVSRVYRRRYGDYLGVDTLVELSWLSPERLASELDCLLATGCRDVSACASVPMSDSEANLFAVKRLDRKYFGLKLYYAKKAERG